METLNDIKKALNTSKDIRKVVSTMKVLSSANVKRYENIVKILYVYKSSVELALQALTNYGEDIRIEGSSFFDKKKEKSDLIIIFGSNQGLCGKFNIKILDFLKEDLNNNLKNRIVVVGERLGAICKANEIKTVKNFSIPNSVNKITSTVYELLRFIKEDFAKNESNRVFLYYTNNDETQTGTLTKIRLVPINKEIFKKIKDKTWITNNIPCWDIDNETLLLDLIEQYIFIMINDALLNSMTSEQKNRLITLQSAENNIDDMIKIKSASYNQKRQTTITSELLDVISGYKISKKNKIEI